MPYVERSRTRRQDGKTSNETAKTASRRALHPSHDRFVLTQRDIESYYQQYGPSVLRRCRGFLRNEALAWDAMHQTFVRALQYRETFRGDSTPLAWLYAIASRVCLRLLRRESDLPLDADAHEASLVVDASELDGFDRREQVARLLALFDAELQRIVLMRYFDGLDLQQIADELQVSERTIARRLKDFLERSRAHLQVA